MKRFLSGAKRYLLAFREYDFSAGITGDKWVGFPAPIILAMLINQIRNKKWKKTVQTTVYIPYFISVVVMVSMINIMFANESGVVGNFLKAIHLFSGDTNILGKESAFVPLYVLTGVWQTFGWNSIIFIASISNSNLVNLGQVTFLPKDIRFYGYQQIMEDSRIWKGYANTILYVVTGTALNMVVTMPAAYALSRRNPGLLSRIPYRRICTRQRYWMAVHILPIL